MDTSEMKKCPYCAEMIKAEAIKCRFCGSTLTRKFPGAPSESPSNYWQRVNEGKKLAGVCTGLARQFESPVLILPLRVFFLVTTLFYGFGLIVYVALWILMPPPRDAVIAKNEAAAAPPAYAPPAYAPPQPGRYGQTAPPAVETYPGRGGPAAPDADHAVPPRRKRGNLHRRGNRTAGSARGIQPGRYGDRRVRQRQNMI